MNIGTLSKTAILVLTLFLLSFLPGAFADTQIDVYDQDKNLTKSVVFALNVNEYFVDDQTPGVKTDAAPFIENDRTYVPIRYLSNALGVTNENIAWESPTVTLTEPGFPTVELAVGNKTIKSDGNARQMDVSPLNKNSRTFLPARFVAEALGYEVDWDAANQIVTCWPKGTEKPDVQAVVDYLKDQKPEPKPEPKPEEKTGTVDIKGKGQPIPAELEKYLTPEWKINYVTMADLNKNDYQMGDVVIKGLRVEKDYFYVKQENANWSTIRTFLWEGDKLRTRDACDLMNKPPVYEVKYSVIDEQRDAKQGTAKIENIRYICLDRGETILAVENPLYKGR